MGKQKIECASSDVRGRPDVFPGVSCSPHFRFLDPAGCATCTTRYSAPDFLTFIVVRLRCRPPSRGRTSGDCQTYVKVEFRDILS
jgi:hypothetical protein